MIDYQLYCQIRQMRDQEKMSVGQIARALGIERKTVRKWMGRTKFERRQSAEKPRGSKLDAFKGTILRLLHTYPYSGAQLLVRIRDEGYVGGYTVLKDFVRMVRPARSAATCSRQWRSGGTSAVQFGSAEAITAAASRAGTTRRQPSIPAASQPSDQKTAAYGRKM
jgi:hypothetical protein